jgi:hypothetical protein
MERTGKIPEWRKAAYKNRAGLQQDDLRRRREESSVEIRKSKREESLAKRRNLPTVSDSASVESEDEGASSTASLIMSQVRLSVRGLGA